MAGVFIAALLVVLVILVIGYLQGWHIKKQDPDQLATFLRPFYRISHPGGTGPYPTVVAFHGCGGMDLGAVDWMDYLSGLGYATILVDSSTPRGLQREQVCSGRRLWGSERAGDVLVSSHDIRKLPFVDANRLVLLGWSHGAWAIMDLLAMDPPRNLPTNLRRSPDQPLGGVRGIVLFYPFCGFPAKARGRGWERDIPVLMLMAGKDPVSRSCHNIVSTLEKTNRPVEFHVYSGADHAFDMRVEDLIGTGIRPNPKSTADARKRVTHFLSEVLDSEKE